MKKIVALLFLIYSCLQAVELTQQMVQAIKDGNTSFVIEHVKSANEANSKSESGKSALMLAVWEGKETIVQVLLDKSADVNATDKNGKSAYMLAVWRENMPIMRLLESKGADTQGALDIAYLTGNGDIIDYLEKNTSQKAPVVSPLPQP
jgi:ankyrin repeat protein